MAIRALKCPSCGADITLDDSREYGFCSYCGTQIQIGEHINIHVTHEFTGDTPDIHVTNQYYYGDDEDDPKPAVTVEKPGAKKLGWGIALAIVGIIGLCSSGNQELSYIVICLIITAIAAILLISYHRDLKLYRDAVRSTFKHKNDRT